MRLIGFVTDSGSITCILGYLGEPTQALRIAPPARGLPWQEDFDAREGDRFALSEHGASESQGQGVALLGARRTQQQDVAGQSGMDAANPYPSMSLISG